MKKGSNKKHGCLIPIIVLICIVGGFILAIYSAIDIENSKFENVSKDESIKAINILKQCGVEKIDKVERDDMLDEGGLVGYRLSTELDNIGTVCVYFDSEKVRQVRFLGKYLYINQEVVAKAQDFYVTDDEANKYQISCQKTIKEILKSPSTAKFPNITEWGFAKEDGIITIQGYVDSQNSFGAMIRSDFQFKIRLADDMLVSAIIDGKEYANS